MGKLKSIPDESVIGTLHGKLVIQTGGGADDMHETRVYPYLLIFSNHRILGMRTNDPTIKFAVNGERPQITDLDKVDFETSYDKIKEVKVKMISTKTLKVFSNPPHIKINAGMFKQLSLALSDEIMEDTKSLLLKTPVATKLELV